MITTRQKGKTGEDIACEWLKKHDFLVVERNYLKKWGEIDIIATKDRVIHFIEVKSVTFDPDKPYFDRRPEENVHELKVRRLRRTIETYLFERRYGQDAPFQFHIISIFINMDTHRASVKLLENIVL